eukprot:8049338-Pyramimonas_sp.AAC.1
MATPLVRRGRIGRQGPQCGCEGVGTRHEQLRACDGGAVRHAAGDADVKGVYWTLRAAAMWMSAGCAPGVGPPHVQLRARDGGAVRYAAGDVVHGVPGGGLQQEGDGGDGRLLLRGAPTVLPKLQAPLHRLHAGKPPTDPQ